MMTIHKKKHNNYHRKSKQVYFTDSVLDSIRTSFILSSSEIQLSQQIFRHQHQINACKDLNSNPPFFIGFMRFMCFNEQFIAHQHQESNDSKGDKRNKNSGHSCGALQKQREKKTIHIHYEANTYMQHFQNLSRMV